MNYSFPKLDDGGFPIYIGIDDTDSVKAMCTTYLVSELMLEFSECDVIGYPRLVRLNPNVPWKTRGNGAIALRLGKGSGKRFKIGEIKGKECYGYERGRSIDIEDIGTRIKRIVEANAQFEDKNTNPAFVVMRLKPPQWIYWSAVRDIVDLKVVIKILKKHSATFKGYKNRRGLVGATAAISWRPRDKTHEVITYREKIRWGTERRVSKNSVIKMDKSFSSTFNNYDYRNRVVVITPNSPCPVLFGIRGNKPKDLLMAKDIIKSEKKDRWVLFKTNQGTDEHLLRKKIEEISKYHSVITSGRICSSPKTIEGGHVILSIINGSKIDCAAYEPTKEFRALIRKLLPGDIITVYGGVREKPLTINIEKIRIEKLRNNYEKIGNPLCPKCRKRMKSIGKNAGYRCLRCGTKVGEHEVILKKVKRDIQQGFYEVPVCARRHLAKPLKRFKSSTGKGGMK
jgi:tRNA(Ile2)-agmatinylcytidine synthase